jgi:hypothetical protein
MQPVIYLLVRLVLSWLQYLEREDRAFRQTSQAVLVAGAAHCWAVVYALFVAVLARCSRGQHVHVAVLEELLPWWVAGAERLAAFSMIIWWLVGCLRLLAHIMEDDHKILPMDYRDVGIPALLRAARSPAARLILAGAQAVSCTGIFLSMMLLSFALLVVSGSVSACEFGLVVASLGFALPMCVMSVQHLTGSHSMAVARSALAAAAEAACLGPQFCVVLALMDLRDHAHTWRLIFPGTALLFAVSIGVCAHSPPRMVGAAVPPDVSEIVLSVVLDFISVVVLALAFAQQTNWSFYLTCAALVLVVVIACVLLAFRVVRDAATELLEPIMPLRSEMSKPTPGPLRDSIRIATRAMVLISGVIAFLDIGSHVTGTRTQQQADPAYYDYSTQPPYMDSHHDEHHNYYDHDDYPHADYNGLPKEPYVVRWVSSLHPGKEPLLEAVAEALGYDAALFKEENGSEEHRVMLFSFQGDELNRPKGKNKWQEWLEDKPDAKMHAIADITFPSHLEKALCDTLHMQDYPDDDYPLPEDEHPPAPPDGEDVGLAGAPASGSSAAVGTQESIGHASDDTPKEESEKASTAEAIPKATENESMTTSDGISTMPKDAEKTSPAEGIPKATEDESQTTSDAASTTQKEDELATSGETSTTAKEKQRILHANFADHAAQDAYKAACEAWEQNHELYYGEHYHHYGHYDEHDEEMYDNDHPEYGYWNHEGDQTASEDASDQDMAGMSVSE